MALNKPKLGKDGIKNLAKRIMANEVYTDRYLPNPEMMGMVFMPLMLMEKEDLLDIQKNNPAMIYADYKDALPRSINGQPMFTEISFVWDKGECSAVLLQCQKIKNVMDGEPKKETPIDDRQLAFDQEKID